MVERETLNLVVAGSIPAIGKLFVFCFRSNLLSNKVPAFVLCCCLLPTLATQDSRTIVSSGIRSSCPWQWPRRHDMTSLQSDKGRSSHQDNDCCDAFTWLERVLKTITCLGSHALNALLNLCRTTCTSPLRTLVTIWLQQEPQHTLAGPLLAAALRHPFFRDDAATQHIPQPQNVAIVTTVA